MPSSERSWSWRSRARDPRFAGLLGLAAAAAFLGSALFGGSGWELVLGLVLVVALFGALALVLLPPWQDAAHTPRSGAMVLGIAALVVAGVAVAVH